MNWTGKNDGAAQDKIHYSLAGIRELMQYFGNVHEQLKIIHAAGTNGKGSVCAMLAQILAKAGYRTGLYASPAVFEPEEIISVDGAHISPQDFRDLLAQIEQACAEMVKKGLPHPTAFEMETAAAFCYFHSKKCDLVVLEAGLGGTLDATNLITHPVCSVFTSISRDHMAFLGETLTKIAAAKAGIIKPGCPCVTAPQEPEVTAVLEKAAGDAGSTFWQAQRSWIQNYAYSGQGSSFETKALGGGFKKICARLTGACQKDNFACVLAAVRLFRKLGMKITPEAAAQGIAETMLPGRMERIGPGTEFPEASDFTEFPDFPEFYIDGAHNEKAAWFLKETVQNCFAGRTVVYIIGVFADKEYDKVLKLMLPHAARVFTVTPDHQRALDADALAKQAGQYHPDVLSVPDIGSAVRSAVQAAGTDGVVLAFGSFSYLGDLRQAVRDRL